MCGIGGIVALRPIPDLGALLGRMSSRLSHRGPDDEGYLAWSDGVDFALGRDPSKLGPGRLGLVHRRLSIFDLSPLGWQPMCDASGRRAIVFNGEIYNHPELRTELEQGGHRFKSASDTEVLLELLARHGHEALPRIVGMYAFAYVDFDRRRLMLARDSFGIKPLHYAISGGMLAFASEISPLLEVGAASAAVDRATLFRYLRHAVTNSGPATVFADVRELEPGQVLEVALDAPLEPRLSNVLRLAPRAIPRRIAPADAAAELRDILTRSVALHMRADVPCAAALSGGVDSSTIVSIMRRQAGDDAPLDVFTYVAGDARLDESRWAGIVASSVRARVHEVRLTPAQLPLEIDELIRRQEQPFTTTSMWAQAHVYRAAHEAGFKIVIDGQGADEAFAGYPYFHAARLEGLVRAVRLKEAAQYAHRLKEQHAGSIVQAAGGLLPRWARGAARHAVRRPVVAPWLNGDWFGDAAAEHTQDHVQSHSPLSTALFDAVTRTSLPMLLRYADRNAMTASIENRVPFLTSEVVSFALSLPDEVLIAADGTLKRVIRDAMRGIVPDPVLDRRDKIGFETPEAEWFRTCDGVRRMASDAAAGPLPPCFTPALRDELAALGDGRRPFAPHLWRAINAIRWAHLFKIDFDAAPMRGKAA